MGGILGGGGGSSPPPQKRAIEAQRSVTAQKMATTDMTEQEKLNRRLAASLITNNWGSPATTKKTGLVAM